MTIFQAYPGLRCTGRKGRWPERISGRCWRCPDVSGRPRPDRPWPQCPAACARTGRHLTSGAMPQGERHLPRSGYCQRHPRFHPRQRRRNGWPLVLGLMGLIRVRDGTQEQFLAPVFGRVLDLRPVLYVQKGPPGLLVPGETLHERGVTVLAGMEAAHIGVYGIVRYRKVGFGEDGFNLDFLDFHLVCGIEGV